VRATETRVASCVVVNTVRAAEARFGCSVGLIIIDPNSKAIALGGGDGDKARDQNALLANLRCVQQRLDIHIAGIGHTGKNESRGERGSNARRGDADVEVQITGDDIKAAIVTKANDQPQGPLTTFRLKSFALGVDEDGDPFTTSIISEEIFDGDVAKPKSKVRRRQSVTLSDFRIRRTL
jgi:hypothetical protein